MNCRIIKVRGGIKVEEKQKVEELDQEIDEVEKQSKSSDTTDEPTVEEVSKVEESTNEDVIQTLESEKQALEEKVLRLQAEIANMQRINQKERQDAAKYRSQNLATELLDVVDNLERALATETTSEDAVALKKGVEMVVSQLKLAFEREKIQEINPEGEVFNPNFHQAVSVMAGDEETESDTVLNVLQKGYQLHDRVLRPAMVIVSE